MGEDETLAATAEHADASEPLLSIDHVTKEYTTESERVRALNGTFELSRERGRTVVRCRLPLEQEADA